MRSSRLVLAATLIAAAMLSTPDAADAQPICAAHSLTDFLAPGFACTIGPWRLAAFDYVATTLGDNGIVADATEIGVTPFSALDAAGRRTFGLAFDGFAASVHPANAPAGIAGALASNHLAFTIEAVRSGPRLLGAAFDLGAGIAGDDVAAQFLSGSASALVTGLTDATDCGSASADHQRAVGITLVHVATPCTPGPVAAVHVALSTSGFFIRDDPNALDGAGHAGGRVDRATFIVAPTIATPEPSTIVLLAGGLAAIGAAGIRRRARAA